MTKDEIKKALKCCQDYDYDSCADCPYRTHSENCTNDILQDALDLITEQEKENEKLEQLNAIQCDAWQKLSDENESLATENSSYFRYNSVLRKNNQELKAEIKQLKAEYEQAKIDVLNELKTRHDYAIKNMGYPWDISQQIDELIKEIEDDNSKY